MKKAATPRGVTVHDMVRQLDEDREFARDQEAAGHALAASMGKARVLGFLNDKVELTGKGGGPIELSDAELARLIAFQLTKAGG
jgi:hypothetical protein